MRFRREYPFAERVFAAQRIANEAAELALSICAAQSKFGDFHLKTTLAIAAANLLMLRDGLDRKLNALNIGLDREAGTRSLQPRWLAATSAGVLGATASKLAAITVDLESLAKRTGPFTDISLRKLAIESSRSLRRDLAVLEQWKAGGVTPTRQLARSAGLLRDCDLFVATAHHPSGRKPIGLRDRDLSNPLLRACYLSANAYLEITSIDIVSDLITRCFSERPRGYQELVGDLSRQLLDEARHAELLGTCVNDLGFELGCAPVSLHTWHSYLLFPKLAEKLVVQQVLQEGVGLDSSAQNVLRMMSFGDRRAADTYAQITADERNHVALGVRWVPRLDSRSLDSILDSVLEIVERVDPLPEVPVVVELRRLAGYPERSLEQDVVRRGRLAITEIHRTILAARW